MGRAKYGKAYFCFMLYFLALVRHFLCSNSRHGTHSPFVYNIASDVIYSSELIRSKTIVSIRCEWKKKPNYFWLVEDILKYLGIDKLSDKGRVEAEAYWADLAKDRVEDLIERVDHGQLLIIQEPYLDVRKWNKLIESESIVVSIDLFHFGIVLKRDEQHKENFKLRFPYWRRNR